MSRKVVVDIVSKKRPTQLTTAIRFWTAPSFVDTITA